MRCPPWCSTVVLADIATPPERFPVLLFAFSSFVSPLDRLRPLFARSSVQCATIPCGRPCFLSSTLNVPRTLSSLLGYSVTEPTRFPVCLSVRHGAELPTAFISSGFPWIPWDRFPTDRNHPDAVRCLTRPASRLDPLGSLPDRSEPPRRGTLPHSSRLPLLCRPGDDPDSTRYTDSTTPVTYDTALTVSRASCVA